MRADVTARKKRSEPFEGQDSRFRPRNTMTTIGEKHPSSSAPLWFVVAFALLTLPLFPLSTDCCCGCGCCCCCFGVHGQLGGDRNM